MFHWVMLVLFAIVWSPARANESAASLYNQGNTEYRQGDYASAISIYEQVIGQGLKNGDVYYNLGNAYFKSNELGKAILSYERALKLMPGDEDVIANLKFANAHKVDKDEPTDPNFITRVLLAIYDFFQINTLSVLSLVSVFCIGGSVVGWLFMPLRKMLWICLIVVFGFGLLSSSTMLAFKAQKRSEVAAIVLSAEAIGRSGPGGDFLQVFELHEGTKVFVERSEGSWFLVRLANGVGGWVDGSALEKI